MNKYFITFGSDHRHAVNGAAFDRDSIGVINSPSYIEAREIAFDLFGPRWAFLYTENDKGLTPSLYPRGFIEVN